MSQRHKRATLGQDSAGEVATVHGDTYLRPSFYSPDLGDDFGDWDSVVVDTTGLVITLTYPEDITYGGTGLKDCFTVYSDGVAKTISTAVTSGDDAIVLTMAAILGAGNRIEIKFVNDGDLVRDSDDAEIPDGGISVRNTSNPPNTFRTATVPTTGRTIVMGNATNVAAVKYGGAALKDCFTVLVGTDEMTISSAAIGSGVITLTLSDALLDGDTVTVAFANDGDVLRVSDDAVIPDTDDPIEAVVGSTLTADFTTAAVDATGLKVTLSNAVKLDYTGGSDLDGCFVVTVDDTPASTTGGVIKTDTTKIELTMTAAIEAGQVVTVAFTNDADLVRGLTSAAIPDTEDDLVATNASEVTP